MFDCYAYLDDRRWSATRSSSHRVQPGDGGEETTMCEAVDNALVDVVSESRREDSMSFRKQAVHDQLCMTLGCPGNIHKSKSKRARQPENHRRQ